MKSIAVFNNKGGVGKTTLLTNLAAHLALKHQKKILVIDADPQCNATQSLFHDGQLDSFYEKRSTATTIHSVVAPLSKGRGFASDISTTYSPNFGLDVLIGDPNLGLRSEERRVGKECPV